MLCSAISFRVKRTGIINVAPIAMTVMSVRHAHNEPTASPLGHAGGARRVLNRVITNSPLRTRDPASRSVMIPESFHGRKHDDTDDYSYRDSAEEESRGGGKQSNYEKNQSHRQRGSSSGEMTAEDAQKRARALLMKQLTEDTLWQGHIISDKNNSLIQRFKESRNNARFRDAKKMVVLSSRSLMKEIAEKVGIYPKTLLLVSRADSKHKHRHSNKEETRFSPEDANYINAAAKKGCEIIKVSPQMAEEIEPGNDGFIGDFSMPEPPPIEDIIANQFLFKRVLVLDNVDDPGHLGTLLRTSAAMDYDAVFLINHCADLYHHTVLRAARGIHFMKSARFYVLKEENGDDAFGMINHVIKRNKLDVVAFTPLPFEVSAKRKALAGPTRQNVNQESEKSVPQPPKSVHTDDTSMPSTPSYSPFSVLNDLSMEYTSDAGNGLKATPYNNNNDTQLKQGASNQGERRGHTDNSNMGTSSTNTTIHGATSAGSLQGAFSEPGHGTQTPIKSPTQHQNAATAEKLATFLKSRFSDPYMKERNKVSIAIDRIVPSGDSTASSSYTTTSQHHTDEHSPQEIANKGFLVMMGPDHKANLVRKIEQKVIRPATVLQLDTNSQSNFMVAVPVVMYALRPFGQYDYLPSYEKKKMLLAISDTAHKKGQTTKEKLRVGKAHRHIRDQVQIGYDYIMPPDKNFDEEEQMIAADRKMWWQVKRRELKKKRSDHGLYLEYQSKKIAHYSKRALLDAKNPLMKYTGSGMAFFKKAAPKEPDWLPNINTDYMQGIDRDVLQEEAENASKRSDGYDVLMNRGSETVLRNPSSKFAWEASGALRNPR
eukprot:Tbor_TRINITY_DN5649_c0_g8::TRINITY_DN5649_c0_g8_i1::g.8383::m.8383